MIATLVTNKNSYKKHRASPYTITNGHVYEIKIMKIHLGRWESLGTNRRIEYSIERKLKGGFPMIVQQCG
jgi:hypothetical protein